jgi:hypothetical protein
VLGDQVFEHSRRLQPILRVGHLLTYLHARTL